MIDTLILKIEIIVRELGPLGVFIATLIEEFIAPIPSSLVAMTAGFFLVPAKSTFWQALKIAVFQIGLPMSIGITISSLVIYTLTYFGGKPIIERYGRWFGINWQEIERIEAKFIKGYADEFILLGLRIMPGMPNVAISALFGLIRYPAKMYTLLTSIGSFIRSTILGIIGWQVRGAYIVYADTIDKFGSFVFVGIVAVITFIFLWRFIKNKKLFYEMKIH